MDLDTGATAGDAGEGDGASSSRRSVRLCVNGRWVEAPAGLMLLRFLRDGLSLTGTKEGCSGGRCGACTVLVDGRPRVACRTEVGRIAGAHVTTIEGLGTPESPHPLQRAFVESGAVQCGFCTPAMILEAKALLDLLARPSREDIIRVLDRHLCRCTGYVKIVEAVELGGRYLRGETEAGSTASGRHIRDAEWRRSTARPTAGAYGAAGRVVGRSAPQKDALPKACGVAKFGADLRLPGQLHLLAVRSPHAHARILRVDTERARATPGVAAVFTAADVPGRNALAFFRADQPVLAVDRVRHRGEAVALVAGETPEAAAAGRDAVEVEYTPLPAVLSVEESLFAGAPTLQDGVTNEFFSTRLEHGPAMMGAPAAPDEGCASASVDAEVEGCFRTAQNEHAYLEPEAGAAYLQEGRVVVEVGTQDAQQCRDQVALVLGLPSGRVDVRRTTMGGGFGGRLELVLPALLGLAAYRTGRPVRMVWSRAESLLVSPKRHAYRMHLRLGADRWGGLTALSAEILGDAGAYATLSPGVLTRSVVHMPGPYRIPSVEVRGRTAYTNGPPCGAMRGFGVPQVTFALECLLDSLAARLDRDPLDFRIQNALRAGCPTATGQVLGDEARYVDTLEALRPAYRDAIREAGDFNASSRAASSDVRRGVGVAGMWYGTGKTALREGAAACLELMPGGRVKLVITGAELGQGLDTVLAMIVAEELSLPTSAVVVSTEGALGSPDGGGTGGNRQTFYLGNAVLAAAEQFVHSMRAAAGEILDRPPNQVLMRDGVLTAEESNGEAADGTAPAPNGPDGALRVTFEELYEAGAKRRFQGSYQGRAAALDSRGQGIPYDAYSFGCQMAEVEVDARTGRVRVLRITVAHDVGTALNPQAVEGQLQGGVMMGIGLALMEEYVPSQTRDLTSYRLPRPSDVPEIRILPIASGRGKGPYGSAGIGECSLLPTAPAIVNAVSAATGVWPRELPLTAPRLRRLLAEARERP